MQIADQVECLVVCLHVESKYVTLCLFAIAPGLTSGLQGSVNVHRDALLLVPQ